MADASASKVARYINGRTCPVCQGSETDPRHQGSRCHGFIAGRWIHCSREDRAGACEFNQRSLTYRHAAKGPCPCGGEHAPAEAPRKQRLVETYIYRDEAGVPRHLVRRYADPKTFRQAHYDADGRVVDSMPKSVKRYLYRLDRIAKAKPTVTVWIVEGEKDVHRLEAEGLLATTSPMGAGKWLPEFADYLAGRRCVVVVDNDDPGRRHATQVASSLVGKAKSVKVVAPPGLAEHGDVSDWLTLGRTVAELKALADAAPEYDPKSTAEAEKRDKYRSTTDALVGMGLDECRFWKTPGGEPYMTADQNGVTVEIPINSYRMVDWLFDQHRSRTKEVPNADAIASARCVFQSQARIHGEVHKAWFRVADSTPEGSKDYAFWLDLCDREGNAVKITAKGWEVVKNPPVKFVRPDVMKPLPTPVAGGDVDELWDFVNVDVPDRPLVVAALTAFMRPRGPYPLLVLGGEQGSAKSTSTRIIKRLIDDRIPILGSLPETPLDLWVVAGSNWLLTFDNISSISKGMSNALCQLALEGGMERRKLHTDAEVSVLEAMRPMILNGIDEFARAPDLVDRVVLLNCPRIDEVGRRDEADLWAAFHAARPRLLGALCDAVAGGLRRLPKVDLRVKPRMADFAIWGEAVCRHVGYGEGRFLDLMFANRDASSAMALEDSPVASAIFDLGRDRSLWSGTCNQLLTELRAASGTSEYGGAWPRSPRGLASHLRRIQPGLRRHGVTINWAGKVRHERIVEIHWTFAEAPPG